jgi:alpha-amylase
MIGRAALLWSLLPGLALAQDHPWADEIIYFVMIDRFADGDPGNNQGADPANPLAFQGGDLAGLTARLPEIASLGATALWITPVVQQIAGPVDNEHGPFWGHHGYWAEEFATLDPRYGSEADLAALVDAAHGLGIKVLLDVVYNHVGYGASWTVTQPDWLRQGDQCGADDVTLCLAGLPDLRTDLPEVRDALFEAHLGLAQRVGLDGFRLDTFKHVEADFWAAHRDQVRARLGEEFLLLGEVWDGDRYLAEAPFAAGTLDGMLDFSFRDRVMRFLQGSESAERLARYLTNRHQVTGGVMAPFLSSHDVPMLLAMLRGDRAKLRIAFALLMMAEGPPVITWGEEVGRAGGPWPDNRGAMPWGGDDQMPGAGLPRDEGLRADLAALIALRRGDPGLHSGPLVTHHAADDVLILQRGDWLIAVNRGAGPVAVGALGPPAGNWWIAWGDGPDQPMGAAMLPGPGVTLWQRR